MYQHVASISIGVLLSSKTEAMASTQEGFFDMRHFGFDTECSRSCEHGSFNAQLCAMLHEVGEREE